MVDITQEPFVFPRIVPLVAMDPPHVTESASQRYLKRIRHSEKLEQHSSSTEQLKDDFGPSHDGYTFTQSPRFSIPVEQLMSPDHETSHPHRKVRAAALKAVSVRAAARAARKARNRVSKEVHPDPVATPSTVDTTVPDYTSTVSEETKGLPRNKELEMREFLDENSVVETQPPFADISNVKSIRRAVSTEPSPDSPPSSAYMEVQVSTILDFSGLLYQDDEIITLYHQVISRLGSTRFKRNFTRLLKKYSKSLKQEATNDLHIQAARFVRQYAHRVANELTNIVRAGYSDYDPALGAQRRISKDKELGRWIEPHGWLRNAPEKVPTDEDHGSSFDSSDSSTTSDNVSSSINGLEGIRNFLVSAEAYSILRRDLKQWLNTQAEESYTDDKLTIESIPDAKYSVLISLQIPTRIIDVSKRIIERFVGCKLSWWPLAQPEYELNTGYTRVYSKSLV